MWRKEYSNQKSHLKWKGYSTWSQQANAVCSVGVRFVDWSAVGFPRRRHLARSRAASRLWEWHPARRCPRSRANRMRQNDGRFFGCTKLYERAYRRGALNEAWDLREVNRTVHNCAGRPKHGISGKSIKRFIIVLDDRMNVSWTGTPRTPLSLIMP